MTREEAIKMLDYLAVDTTGTLAGEQGAYAEFLVRVIDSLDMAIDALREQESAKNAHCNCGKKTNSSWISVEDRLPESDTLVLCVGVKGGMFLGENLRLYDGENAAYCHVPNYRYRRAAVYWMPLPEPPEVEA